MRLEGLRIPWAVDAEASLYKDWLHLNLFDWRSGLVGLVNVALHGAPYDTRARVVGTALMHLPEQGWLGNVETLSFTDATVRAEGIGLRNVALAIDPRAAIVMASVRLPIDGVRADVTAQVDGPTHSFPQRLPLGSGWISWAAAPRLRTWGQVEICGGHIDLSAAVAYHDHNWGRWRWGDDIGWEWGCFADRKHRSVFVYTQTTDRDHRRRGRPMLLVYAGGHRRTFAGLTVVVDYAAELATSPRRVPGALAALHSDRAQPRQPTRVELRANDGVDSVHLRFHAEAVAQILTAEPTAPGYGFIHEIAGRFEASGQINRTKLTAEGLAIVEHVD